MNRVLHILIFSLLCNSCSKEENDRRESGCVHPEFISAVDISSYPEISMTDPVFYDLEGNENDFLTILQGNGVNTIRLRLWVNPSSVHSGFPEVRQFCADLKMLGFKTWITLHYSDTWADPGHQLPPVKWQGIDFMSLKDSLYTYTERVISDLQPDYVQIGNEINTGFLHPYGHITNNYLQFLDLMDTAIAAVRTNSIDTELILHYAGSAGSDWFFNQVAPLDYDIIGLSYYPIWHGKSLDSLQAQMQYLSAAHSKKLLIAETAYPFTLSWNDWTNNIVGLEEQLILPEYPASVEGQRNFIKRIRSLVQEVENGVGFCYWGAELIAWKGNQAADASPWENQALFDFNNNALPVLREFRCD